MSAPGVEPEIAQGRVENRARTPLKRRIGEALLILAIPVAMYFGAVGGEYAERGRGGEDLREEALFKAAWVV